MPGQISIYVHVYCMYLNVLSIIKLCSVISIRVTKIIQPPLPKDLKEYYADFCYFDILDV